MLPEAVSSLWNSHHLPAGGRSPGSLGTADRKMLHPGFSQLKTEVEGAIEQGHGFLKRPGHLSPADGPHVLLMQCPQVLSLEANRPHSPTSARYGKQSQYGHRAYRLAASRLADGHHPFALTRFIREIVDGTESAPWV